MNAVFYHNEQQKKLAVATKLAIEKEKGKTVYTKILPVGTFFKAEDYHQKYLLSLYPELVKELAAVYPAKADFTNATSTARLNGYVGGYGTKNQLRRELHSLGLSEAGKRYLEKAAR